MIIRNQDKTFITNFQQVTDVGVAKVEDVFAVIAYYQDNGSKMNIGFYSTKEKAIKVLDMIQAEYVKPIYRNVVAENEIAIYQSKVFQIPQDSEV